MSTTKDARIGEGRETKVGGKGRGRVELRRNGSCLLRGKKIIDARAESDDRRNGLGFFLERRRGKRKDAEWSSGGWGRGKRRKSEGSNT